MLRPWQAVVLGAVQGMAEVHPVSSSAQLALLPGLLGWPPPVDRTGFAAGLHAGSCAGLLVALRADLRALDGRQALLLALSTVPAALAGLLGRDAVEQRLGRPVPTALLLAGGATLLWLADGRPQDHALGDREVAVAALAQVVALAPGVSRSGAVLTALRALRVPREQATRHSRLMSLPVTAGAAALTLARADRSVLAAPLLVGAPAAATAALLAARHAQARPYRRGTGAALYRVALAAAVVAQRRRDRA